MQEQHRRAFLAVALLLAPVLAGGAAPAAAADPALVAAARKEGEVIWYTTQIINQLVRPMVAGFEKAYPGIKVSAVRANATDTAIKLLNEGKAGRMQADVFDGTTTVVPLKEAGLVMKYVPDSAKALPKDYIDADGYWVSTNIYVLTPGYNTDLVKKADAPKTLQDLLAPKWRGHIAWGATESSSAGPGFIGTILAEMGEDKGMAYLKQLSGQKLTNISLSAREILDQVIAGEYPLALQIFNHHAVISEKKGAPVDWIKLEPATGTLSVVSVTAQAPHPNAAKLLVDYLISPAGQAIYRDNDYLTADPAVPPVVPELIPSIGKFHARFFTPEETSARMPVWMKIFQELFR
jgi:ABC-type Fe3+ transport system substrate-binding protein